MMDAMSHTVIFPDEISSSGARRTWHSGTPNPALQDQQRRSLSLPETAVSVNSVNRLVVKASADLVCTTARLSVSFLWFGRCLHREPVFVGPTYVRRFIFTPLSGPVFCMIEIQLDIHDGESFGVNRILVTFLIRDTHGAMTVKLGGWRKRARRRQDTAETFPSVPWAIATRDLARHPARSGAE
jgi:hypothetical protein